MAFLFINRSLKWVLRSILRLNVIKLYPWSHRILSKHWMQCYFRSCSLRMIDFDVQIQIAQSQKYQVAQSQKYQVAQNKTPKVTGNTFGWICLFHTNFTHLIILHYQERICNNLNCSLGIEYLCVVQKRNSIFFIMNCKWRTADWGGFCFL